MSDDNTKTAVAAQAFTDSHTGREYAEGEALTGSEWSDHRIAKYVARGLARYTDTPKTKHAKSKER